MAADELTPQVQALLEGMAAAGAPPIYELGPEEARGATAAVRELVGPGPAMSSVDDVTVPTRSGSIPVRVYEPGPEVPGTVVYYHGGGWVIGCVDDWDAVCRVLAVKSGCRVLSVEYRLAPENRYPAAADDAYDAYLWATREYGGPVVVAGDSAGGNLAAVTALRSRDEDGPAPVLQVLVYPVVNHDFKTGSYEQFADTHLILNRREMVWFWDHYLPDPGARSHPYASPLRAPDLSGLPPTLVVTAGHDPLRDEGAAYVDRLNDAGVAVQVFAYPHQIHAFFTLVGVLDDADRAVGEVADAIRLAVGDPPSSP